MLNTIVAEELGQFTQRLAGAADMDTAVRALVRDVAKEHKRIIFNGDGYSEEWLAEAQRRGLLNLPTTVDALPRYLDQKNIQLFVRHKIYTEAEMEARYETIMEEYVKTLAIESLTMSAMVRQDVIPAVSGYVASLAQAVSAKRAAVEGLPCAAETALIRRLSGLLDQAFAQVEQLDPLLRDPKTESPNILTAAQHYRDQVIPAMERLRATVDEMEQNVCAGVWPYPTYAELMFHI